MATAQHKLGSLDVAHPHSYHGLISHLLDDNCLVGQPTYGSILTSIVGRRSSTVCCSNKYTLSNTSTNICPSHGITFVALRSSCARILQWGCGTHYEINLGGQSGFHQFDFLVMVVLDARHSLYSSLDLCGCLLEWILFCTD